MFHSIVTAEYFNVICFKFYELTLVLFIIKQAVDYIIISNPSMKFLTCLAYWLSISQKSKRVWLL